MGNFGGLSRRATSALFATVIFTVSPAVVAAASTSSEPSPSEVKAVPVVSTEELAEQAFRDIEKYLGQDLEERNAFVTVISSQPFAPRSTSPYAVKSSYEKIVCSHTIANPHWSKNFGGTIFKSYVSCRGYGKTTVSITHYATLGDIMGGGPDKNRPASGPPRIVLKESETRGVRVNSSIPAVFYHPKGSGPKLPRGRTYEGSITASIAGGTTVGGALRARAYVP